MKHPPLTPNPSPNNWRKLTRQPAPRAAAGTAISQKRHNRTMLKKIAIILALCVVAVAAFEIYTTWKHNPANLKAPVKDKPLKHLAIRTNGVLDEDWAARTLALPKGIDLMELDIASLRTRILSTPQVRTAVLALQIPDTLAITIEERIPVARIAIQHDQGPREELLVAPDGTVYSGNNYAPQTLAALPYLADIDLIRTAPGAHEYLPLNGINRVATLVTAAQLSTPDLYATWRYISLKRYDQDLVLIVHTNRAAQIIFNTREDFALQLARLDYLLADLARNATPDRGPVKTIDFSVGPTPSGIQVPVTFHQRR